MEYLLCLFIPPHMTLDLLALVEERLSIQEENMKNLRGEGERGQ